MIFAELPVTFMKPLEDEGITRVCFQADGLYFMNGIHITATL
jgi:hypothetical protein